MSNTSTDGDAKAAAAATAPAAAGVPLLPPQRRQPRRRRRQARQTAAAAAAAAVVTVPHCRRVWHRASWSARAASWPSTATRSSSFDQKQKKIQELMRAPSVLLRRRCCRRCWTQHRRCAHRQVLLCALHCRARCIANGAVVAEQRDVPRILGCAHYRTGATLSAPCCTRFYVCRFCHDDAQPTHALDRKSVS